MPNVNATATADSSSAPPVPPSTTGVTVTLFWSLRSIRKATAGSHAHRSTDLGFFFFFFQWKPAGYVGLLLSTMWHVAGMWHVAHVLIKHIHGQM